MSEDLPSPPNRQFLFYDTEDGVTRVQMLVDGKTVWMPQKAIAELFETSVANVNIHIGNICDDSEVDSNSVIKEYLITAGDGKQYLVYAEDQARRQKPLTMAARVGKLDAFLEFNDREVLNHAGSIQKKVADQLALEHFDAYSAELRRIEATEPKSDSDCFIDGIKKIKPPRKDEQ